MQMAGKTVLITGSTDGVGRYVAKRLAADGAEVLIHGRDAARAKFASVRNFRGDVGRDHDRAVTVGMDQIVGTHRHPGDTDFTTKIFRMHPGMRGTDRAGQRLKTRRPLRDVADRAIGDDAKAAERLVHIALHLAPERAVADIRPVDVLDHGNARAEAGADIVIIGDAPFGLLGRGQAGLHHRADAYGAGIADHRRQIGKRADQRLGRISDQPALGGDDLHRIANRRRVVTRQSFEDGWGQRAGGLVHERFLRSFRDGRRHALAV